MATRPWSFPASSMPIVATVAYLYRSGYNINWGIAIWTLINIVVFHAAGNTWSDYYDYHKGVDRNDTIGGTSITSGQFEAKEIKRLAIVLLIIAVLGGIALTTFTGFMTLYLGLAGFILTILYPWLKYNALGDLDIFFTYSLLPILGTSFVTTGEVHYSSLWLSVPIGLITVGILHINNTRDIVHDRRAGITTFAMRIGKKGAVGIYCFEMLFPFVWIIACIIAGILPLFSLLAIIALKPAVDVSRKAMSYPSKGMQALIGIDEQTARLQLIFSLLLTVSFILSAILP